MIFLFYFYFMFIFFCYLSFIFSFFLFCSICFWFHFVFILLSFCSFSFLIFPYSFLFIYFFHFILFFKKSQTKTTWLRADIAPAINHDSRGLTEACAAAWSKYTFYLETLISNARLKLVKIQITVKLHAEPELLLFENYSHSSSTLPSKNNRIYSKR